MKRSRRKCQQKRAVVIKLTQTGPIDERKVWEDAGGVCQICLMPVTKATGQIDHIIPLLRGGTHTQENLQLLCGPCNNRKRAKMPKETR